MKRLNPVRLILLLATFAIPGLLVFIRPFGFAWEQAFILGTLLQVIVCWAVELVNRNISSAYLLLCFLCIGEAKPQDVFNFVFSTNFVFIVASFLLSQAIINTKLAERIAALTFKKFASSPADVLLFSFISAVLLIFFIPQSFPRVVIMASLYQSFFNTVSITPKMKTALLFSVFAASNAASALFINGDVSLNYAALGFAGVSLSYVEWITYMFVPSFLLMIAAYFIIRILFGITNEKFIMLADPQGQQKEAVTKLSANEKKVIATSLLLIVLWLTEALHKIPAAYAALAMVAVLFMLGILRISDLKSVNPSILLFLTAAFSIGRTLSINGIAAVVTGKIFTLLPAPESMAHFPAISVMVMVLHLLLGSAVTTLSVVIPALANDVDSITPTIAALLGFTLINMQYFLPIQHVTIMIGAAKGYYSQKETLKTGICFFFVMIFFMLFIFLPWWRFIS
jgi:di/tricarboxylate transporter